MTATSVWLGSRAVFEGREERLAAEAEADSPA